MAYSSSPIQFLNSSSWSTRGAEVSVFPATGLDMRSKQPGPPYWLPTAVLFKPTAPAHYLAASIYTWEFTVAEVSRPLLGADFLRSNSLLENSWWMQQHITPYRWS